MYDFVFTVYDLRWLEWLFFRVRVVALDETEAWRKFRVRYPPKYYYVTRQVGQRNRETRELIVRRRFAGPRSRSPETARFHAKLPHPHPSHARPQRRRARRILLMFLKNFVLVAGVLFGMVAIPGGLLVLFALIGHYYGLGAAFLFLTAALVAGGATWATMDEIKRGDI